MFQHNFKCCGNSINVSVLASMRDTKQNRNFTCRFEKVGKVEVGEKVGGKKMMNDL